MEIGIAFILFLIGLGTLFGECTKVGNKFITYLMKTWCDIDLNELEED